MNYAKVSDSATLAGEDSPPDLDSMYATPAQKKKKIGINNGVRHLKRNLMQLSL